MSNALLRVLTAVVGAPVVLGLLYLGDWYWAGLVILLGLLAQHEVYGLTAKAGGRPFRAWGLLIGACLLLRPMWMGGFPFALLLGTLLMAWLPFSKSEQPVTNIAGTIFGAFYPALLFSFLIDLRQAMGATIGDQEGFLLTLAVFLLIWATDILAYYTGKSIGKHPLAPSVSPKKTWEGSVGGAMGAILVAVALKYTLLAFLAWPHLIVMALICGIVSQLGDLAESKLKRAVGAKDSGTILPGHGGVLDRFDALILAVPLVFLYLKWVAQLFS